MLSKKIDSLQEKKNEISLTLTEKQQEIDRFQEQMGDSNHFSKMYRKCLEDEIEKLLSEQREMRFQILMLEKEMAAFPLLKENAVRLTAKGYLRAITNAKEINKKRREIIKFVHRITIGVTTIETTINLGFLLESAFPITCTIIENRDSIALSAKQNTQANSFSELQVCL